MRVEDLALCGRRTMKCSQGGDASGPDGPQPMWRGAGEAFDWPHGNPWNALAKPIEPGPAMPDRLIARNEPAQDLTPRHFPHTKGSASPESPRRTPGDRCLSGPTVYTSWSFCGLCAGIPGTIRPACIAAVLPRFYDLTQCMATLIQIVTFGSCTDAES